MNEIKQMYHKATGEIVFEDMKGNWYRLDYSDYDPMRGADTEWMPTVATKIDNPLLTNPGESQKMR